MNKDRILTLAAFVLGIAGAIGIVKGYIIPGLIVMLAGGMVFWFRSSGSYNARSLYEKVIKSPKGAIDAVYDELSNMDTPLGRPWVAEHIGYSGDSIVFGPGRYKDMVVISYDDKHREYSIKHINKIENIRYNQEDAFRFDNLIDAADIDVTPANYSSFAADKVICVILLMHLKDMVEMIVNGSRGFAPEKLDMFSLRYYNSGEGYMSDTAGNHYMKCEGVLNPFKARVLSETGDELARIEHRALDKDGRPDSKEGFDLFMNNTHFANIERVVKIKSDTFYIEPDDKSQGQFRITNLMPVDRANLSQNYTVTQKGKLMAVIGGNRKLDFEGYGRCENDIILSFNDDYMELYTLLTVFIMTVNDFSKKKGRAR